MKAKAKVVHWSADVFGSPTEKYIDIDVDLCSTERLSKEKVIVFTFDHPDIGSTLVAVDVVDFFKTLFEVP